MATSWTRPFPRSFGSLARRSLFLSRLVLVVLVVAHLPFPSHLFGATAFNAPLRRACYSMDPGPERRPFSPRTICHRFTSRISMSRSQRFRRRSLLFSSADGVATQKQRRPLGDYIGDFEYEILSEVPLVYVVSNLLSPEECRAYIDRVTLLTDIDESRKMTRSNPPQVSLDAKRLWPLPLLCIGAAVPSLIRLFGSYPEGASPAVDEILRTALPPVAVAAAVAATLAYGVTQVISRRSASTSRTSEALALNAESDVDFIRDLVERASAAAGGHPWHAFEAPVVTRYQTGAVFASHNDASPTMGSEWSDLGGQRVVTVITYLNTCPQGGGTKFHRLGLTVQPREGSALIFFPAAKDTLVADDRTRHESLPAVEEKYIVQLFGRVGPRVPPPLGIPDSYSERP